MHQNNIFYLSLFEFCFIYRLILTHKVTSLYKIILNVTLFCDQTFMTNITRGVNRAGLVGSGLGLGRISLTFWKKSGQARSGQGRVNLHIVFFQIFDDFH
jgi:hypothetical protein